MLVGVDKYALIGDAAILYEYEGAVDKQVLLETLPRIEDILDSMNIDRQRKRKIVNIAIETLQNLQLHSYPVSESDYDW